MTRRSFSRSMLSIVIPVITRPLGSLRANTGRSDPERKNPHTSDPQPGAFRPIDPLDLRPGWMIFEDLYSRAVRDGWRPVVFTVGVFRRVWERDLREIADRLPTWPGEDFGETACDRVRLDLDGSESPTGMAGFLCVPVA